MRSTPLSQHRSRIGCFNLKDVKDQNDFKIQQMLRASKIKQSASSAETFDLSRANLRSPAGFFLGAIIAVSIIPSGASMPIPQSRQRKKLEETPPRFEAMKGGRPIKDKPASKHLAVITWEESLFSNGMCSGTLISNKHVLTAQHCVISQTNSENTKRFSDFSKPNAISVSFPDGDRSRTYTSSKHSVKRIYFAPKYYNNHYAYNEEKIPSTGFPNDLAILELSNPIDTERAKDIPSLLTKEEFTSLIAECKKRQPTITLQYRGFGYVNSEDPEQHAREAEGSCQDYTEYKMFQLKESTGTPSHGDSGGGVYLKNNGGEYQLIGVISGGTEKESWHVSIDLHRELIDGVLNGTLGGLSVNGCTETTRSSRFFTSTEAVKIKNVCDETLDAVTMIGSSVHANAPANKQPLKLTKKLAPGQSHSFFKNKSTKDRTHGVFTKK